MQIMLHESADNIEDIVHEIFARNLLTFQKLIIPGASFNSSGTLSYFFTILPIMSGLGKNHCICAVRMLQAGMAQDIVAGHFRVSRKTIQSSYGIWLHSGSTTFLAFTCVLRREIASQDLQFKNCSRKCPAVRPTHLINAIVSLD